MGMSVDRLWRSRITGCVVVAMLVANVVAGTSRTVNAARPRRPCWSCESEAWRSPTRRVRR